MKYKLEYNNENKYIEATLEDEIELKHLSQLLTNIMDKLKTHNCKKILYDMRGASVNMNILEIDEIPKLVAQLGIDSSITRALIISDDFKKFNFFESTSRAHNQNVKIFTNFAEAEEWLLNDMKSTSQAISVPVRKESE